jgi:hypothetical protein
MPGLDRTVLDTLDPALAIRRIRTDVRSDFILAPHFSAVYANASDELWDEVRSQLSAGTYEFGLPITVDVPKASGLTRPGSILLPPDRLVYQLLVDAVAPAADEELDREQVFSQQLLSDDPRGLMFSPSDQAWREYQERVSELCADHPFVVRADVASFFERLNQHYLINLLEGAGANRSAVKLLEQALLAFAEKDSYGIIQGVFPSDYLGTFYLHGLDSHFQLNDVPFARYTDDLFAFFDSEREARQGLAQMCRILRHEGLHLNEAKSRIATSQAVLYEETELDRMFAEAREEVEEQLIVTDWYNMQITWLQDDDEETFSPVDEEDVTLSATHALFERLEDEDLPARRRIKIERFTLPALAAARSERAVEYCIEGFATRPHMAQIYSSYLSSLAREDSGISARLGSLVGQEETVSDWQELWVVGAVLGTRDVRSSVVNAALRMLNDASRDVTLRAVCALVVGKHGSAGRRRLLRHRYADEPSEYVRAAILFAARYFPAAERRTAVSAWSGHSAVNRMVGRAVQVLGAA